MADTYTSSVNSRAEDLFVELFCEAFGPERANHLYIQYPFVDIYGNHRFIDFALKNQEMKIAEKIIVAINTKEELKEKSTYFTSNNLN